MKYFHLFLLIGAFWMSGLEISRAAIQIAHIQNCTEPGVNNGFVMAVATGNAGPFDFKWSNDITQDDSNQSTIYNLAPGIYTVTITAVSGCSWELSATVGVCDEIAGQPLIGISESQVVHATVPTFEDGAVFITVINPDNTPLSFTWTNESGEIVGLSEDLIHVPGGFYNVFISNGCRKYSRTFRVYDCSSAPSLSGLKIDFDAVRCATGMEAFGQLTALPNSDYSITYQWSGPGGFQSTAASITAAHPSKENSPRNPGSTCAVCNNSVSLPLIFHNNHISLHHG
jgi:hypothetical protein